MKIGNGFQIANSKLGGTLPAPKGATGGLTGIKRTFRPATPADTKGRGLTKAPSPGATLTASQQPVGKPVKRTPAI